MVIRRSRTGRRSRSGFPDLFKRKWLIVNIAVCAATILIATGIYLSRGPADEAKSDSPKNVAANGESDITARNDRPVEKKKIERVRCRVYTPDPGFTLFVDGNPVQNDDGDDWLTTPCELAVPKGSHQFTIAKAGFQDANQNVNVSKELQEIDFVTPSKAAGDRTGVLASALLNVESRKPILVFDGAADDTDFDPFISTDGNLLFFVSNRGGIKGVYFTTRNSAYEEFDPQPRMIDASRGYNLPASPSLASDNLSIVYTLPKLGTVLALSRDTPIADFSQKQTLQKRRASRGEWPSAQAVRDDQRDWWLYWQQRKGENIETFASRSRQMTTDRVADGPTDQRRGTTKTLAALTEQKFATKTSFDLNGKHPCFSTDGLRQYVFDGKFVKRATRKHFDAPFSELEIVTTMDLDDYAPAKHRRSYTVTGDEQWLVYESHGKLFMIRLFNGPGRGFIAKGTSIPNRVLQVAKLPERKKADPVVAKKKGTPTPKKKPVDPRTVPLPYPQFQKEFAKLLAARDYAAAKKKIAAGLAAAKLAKDHNLIRWDGDELAQVAAFWADVETAVKSMKPNDEFSIGNARVRFVAFKNGQLTAKSRTKTVTKELSKMRTSDLIVFIEKKFGRKDATKQFHIATFLFHEGAGSTSTTKLRFERAGNDGKKFRERQAARELQQARHEFARENIAAGLVRANRILADFPKTPAAAGATQLNEDAYTQTKWQSQGRRTWQQKNGAFTATKRNSPGSLLRSPRQYTNFELRLEWKSDVPTGQGGVFFRYTGRGDLTDNAFKIQLSDDFGVPADNYCTGALFKVEPPSQNAVRERGKWNTLRLRVHGEKIEATINGSKVIDTTAKSETIPVKGYVALDGVLGGITYGRVLLIELPDRK